MDKIDRELQQEYVGRLYEKVAALEVEQNTRFAALEVYVNTEESEIDKIQYEIEEILEKAGELGWVFDEED